MVLHHANDFQQGRLLRSHIHRYLTPQRTLVVEHNLRGGPIQDDDLCGSSPVDLFNCPPFRWFFEREVFAVAKRDTL